MSQVNSMPQFTCDVFIKTLHNFRSLLLCQIFLKIQGFLLLAASLLDYLIKIILALRKNQRAILKPTAKNDLSNIYYTQKLTSLLERLVNYTGSHYGIHQFYFTILSYFYDICLFVFV